MRSMLPGIRRFAPEVIIVLLLSASMLLVCGCRFRTATTASPPRESESLAYPRYDDPDSVIFNDLPVKLYFFTQTPPLETEILRPVRVRATAPSGKTCRDAAFSGLINLQRQAVRHKADAVVNIRASWDGKQLGDKLTYACMEIGGRYTLILEGTLARLPDTETEASDMPTEEDDESERLRKLQRLYYQGLITHDEFLEQRKQILNEL